MAFAFNTSLDQAATLREELVELLEANGPCIEVENLGAQYRRHFKKDLNVKKLGMTSVKTMVASFGHIIETFSVGQRKYLMMKKLPEATKTKMGGAEGGIPVYNTSESLSRVSEPISERYQTNGSSTQGRYTCTLIDLKKDLVELLQSSPERHVELYSLPETYERKYKRALNLTEHGIGTVDAIADTFRDTFEIVNQCIHSKHHKIRIRPDDSDAQQNRGVVKRTKSNSFREDIKELLTRYPNGVKVNDLGKLYGQEYHKNIPPRKVIIDMCGDYFELFSTCSKPSRQFLHLKPGQSKAGGGRRASDAASSSDQFAPANSSQQLPPMVFNNTGLGLFGAAPGVRYTYHGPPSAGIVEGAAGGIGVSGSGLLGASPAVAAASPVPLMGLPPVSLMGLPPVSLMGLPPVPLMDHNVGAATGNPPTQPGQGLLGPAPAQQSQIQQRQQKNLPVKGSAVGLVQQEKIKSVPKVQPVKGSGKKSKKKKKVAIGTLDATEMTVLYPHQTPRQKVAIKQERVHQETQPLTPPPYLKEQLQGQPHKLKTNVKQMDTNQCSDDAVPSSRDKQQKRSASTPQQQQQWKKPRQVYLPLDEPSEHMYPALTSSSQSSGSKQQTPKRSTLNAVAQTVIDNLAAANELVTVDRVVELLKQQFQATSLENLGLQNERQLPALHQLLQLQSKVNAFIQAFVQVRAICTLHELGESLAMVDAPMGSTEKLDYADLQLGPLSKQPLVYQFFKFPPTKDESDIPKITTLDVIKVLNNFLTEKELWRKRVKLEKFMEYILDEYEMEEPYELGLRIQSIGLAIAALKTAKRDQKTIMDRARENLKTSMTEEVAEAMEKIRKAVMAPADITGHQFPSGPQLEVRRLYCNTTAAAAVDRVFNNAYELIAYSTPLRQFCPALRKMVMDKFSRSLFQLAICTGDLSRPTDLPEGILDSEDEDDEESSPEEKKSPVKSQPTADQVCEELQRYLERIQHGNVNLKDLARIEAKLCQHFSFQDFVSINRTKRTFLQFLSLDHPGILESIGGTLMGLVSSNPSQGSVYRPSRMDLVEFIQQCNPCKVSQDILDLSLCAHYQVSNVEELGHGPVNRLSQQIIKMAAKLGQQEEQNAVVYEAALCASNRQSESKCKEVGLFGSQSLESALACLASTPLLEDLAEWSHWSMVFEPEHGNLKAFLEKNPGQSVSPPIEINALEVRPGVLLQLATETSPDHFATAAKDGVGIVAVGQLVSLVAKEGLANAPLALLSNHMETALNVLAVESEAGEMRHSAVIGFVLDCLLAVPLLIGQAVVRQVILNPLTTVIGSEVKSRQLILKACNTTTHRTKIQRLGLLLGISQWKDSFTDERMPRNMDKKEDEGEYRLYFIDLIGTNKASKPTEAAESSSATEVSPNDTPSLQDADELSQTLLEKDEQNAEAQDVLELEKMQDEFGDESEHKLDNLIQASFEDDEEISMEVQEDLCEREGDADESRTVGTGEAILAQGESLNSPLATEEPIKIEDEPEPEPDLTPFQRSVLDCRAVIRSICREEFGVGVELDEQTQRLMDRQRERIGRSLKRLSEELYSKDTHFVLELIQNADDNEYDTGVEPSLVFFVDRSEVTVLNNEVGFSESNIRALCDIGRSTKGKHKRGYIGHKGIGFKSVFRVTDRPEITSKGYHVCFDQSSNQMGYILPTWVGPEEITDVAQMEEPRKTWTTQITLPLKGDFQRTTSLVNKFEDVQPSLLLFLNRLRSIVIVNKEENSTSYMSRQDKGGNLVEIRHSKNTDSWLLIKKCLDAAKLQRVDIESTELGLAFPLSDSVSNEQNVFAYLPLRCYGFRFIIQGDFDIPSSREDVDTDSAWNQWLLREIAPLFIDALENFKAHYHSDPINAVCQFLKFVPMESQILTDFFRKVATNIHQRLKASPCMPVLSGQGEDDVCWKMPSETLLCPDRSVRALVCELIPKDTLREHLSCSYLHPRVASCVSEVLLKSLGVKMLQMGELMSILSSVARAARQREEFLPPKTVAQWLTCIYRSRDKYDVSQGTLDQLRTIPFIPLSSGRVVTIEEGSVFFPITEEDRADQSQGQIQSAQSRPLQALEEDMSTLDGQVLTSLDSVANSQVTQLLEELGVRRVSPRDVIGHHILPVIQSDQWKDKPRDVLVGYLVYIKEQLDRQPDVCDLEKIAACIHVVTNHGLIQPRERPVHFTLAYGNPVDLNQRLPGCDWVLLDSCYIFHGGPHRLQPNQAAWWNAFFRKLGVLNFLAVDKKIVTVKVEELDVTPWADLGHFWEKPADGVYKIHDNTCKEFEELVRADLEMSTMQSQRQWLLQILKQEWSKHYADFTRAEVFDQSGTKLGDTESSFAIHLKTSSWLPSTPIREENTGHVVFRRPDDIFISSVRARELLGNHVPYLDAPVQKDEGPMLQFIGLKTVGVVDVNFMISKLKSWCGDNGQLPDLASRTLFCTSLGHIIRVYSYLEQNCRPQELRELFSDHRVVFVPQKAMPQQYEVPISGQFVHKSLVYWRDPSSLLQKDVNLCSRAQLCTLYPLDMGDFFLGRINVDSMPTIREYAQVLVHCSEEITLPDNARIKDEVLVLYSMLGQKCSAASSSKYSQYLDQHAAGSSSVKFLKDILRGQAVFPTLGNKWVTAEEKPLICDSHSTDIQKLFLDKKEVHLLNVGDRNRLGQVVEGASGSVDQQYVDVFLEACGIEMLSDCIEEEFITELTKPSSQLQIFLHDVCPYICLYMSMQRNAKKEFQSTYEKLTTEVNIAAKLKVMRFMSAKKIDKIYRFRHDPNVFVEQSVDCGLQELKEFYIVTGISQNLRHKSGVRREVAKLFSCGSSEVQEALFSFIGNLLLELGSKREESGGEGINEGICRALRLTYPREDDNEPWEVPKPFIPQGAVFKPPKVKPVPEPTKPQPSARSLLEGDDDAAIHSWPPKSGIYGPQKSTKVGGQPKNEEAVLKMWPLPQPLVALSPPGPLQSTGRRLQPGDGMSHELHYQKNQDDVVVWTSGAVGEGALPYPEQRAGQGGSREGLGPSQLYQPSAGGPGQPRPAQARQEALSPKESLSDTTEMAELAKKMEELGSTEEGSWETASLESGEVKDDSGDEDDPGVGIPALEMVKEEFHSPPQVQRSPFLPHPSTGSVKRFFLPPHTDGEAIEVEFEDLAPGPTLLESLEGLNLPLGDNLDTTDIARWGEQLVYLYLLQQAQCVSPDGTEVKVRWINRQDETGEPYDIVVTCGTQIVYVEVKSTIRDQKQVVEISSRQVAFARQMGQAFHLYRVFNAGNVSGVRLCRLQDLGLRMDRKEVKLFMYL